MDINGHALDIQSRAIVNEIEFPHALFLWSCKGRATVLFYTARAWVMRSNVHCNGRSCQSAIDSEKKTVAITTTIKKESRIVRKVGANPNEYECSSMSMGGCSCASGCTTGMATRGHVQAWAFFHCVHALRSVFRQLPCKAVEELEELELERVFFFHNFFSFSRSFFLSLAERPMA